MLTTELKLFFGAIVTQVNDLLTTGVTIPNIYGVRVNDAEILFNQGFVEGGLTVSKASFVNAQE